MPQEKKTGKRKSFAVIRKADDTFVTMQAATKKEVLLALYPTNSFRIHEMNGKDDIPLKDGAFMSDLTVDESTGEWKWKLTDAEIAARKKGKRAKAIRAELVKVHSAKNEAVALGADFADEAARLSGKIATLEAELAGL